jgi:hypothetical protein
LGSGEAEREKKVPIGSKQLICSSLDFKGFISTGSEAMKIIIIQLTEFSELRYGLKVSEIC